MFELFKSKKGQAGLNVNLLWGLLILAAVIVVSGIFMAFGAQVTSDVAEDFTTDSIEYNITQNSLEAQETLAEKQNTVALIGVITLIIGLLLGVVAGVMFYM